MDQQLSLPISVVERETGISKETLRIWERRYAFPLPVRNDSGKRAYSSDDVARLKLIGLLIKQGHRPSKVIALNLEELKTKILEHPSLKTTPMAFEQITAWLKKGDTQTLKNWLISQIARDGLRPFLENTLGPLLVEVGTAWKAGRLHIHEEHLFSETVQQTLRIIINNLPVIKPHPYVLITTPEGELHGLGLLIVESSLALEGIKVSSLGVNTPLQDIVTAATQLNVDIVIVSMTANYKTLEHREQTLKELRQKLPQHINLYTGGSGTSDMSLIKNVLILKTLEQLMLSIQTANYH